MDQVGRDQVRVKTAGGVRVVKLAGTVTIKLNGKVVSLDQIKVGDRLVAVGRLEGQGQQAALIASALTARRT